MAIMFKGGKWYIDYRVNGRRIRECIGHSKRLAERALAARKGEIVQGRFNFAQRKRSPRLEQAADEYLEWAKQNTRSARSVEVHLLPLKAYFRGKTLRELTPWLIERYKHDRLAAKVHEKALRPTTINRELSCLRRCLNLQIKWGKAEDNPVSKVKFFPEDGRRERILSPAEIQKLVETCTEHSRPFVMLALNTGMRLGEILGLTWDQVDLRQGVITLTRTKSGKWRKIPVNDLTRQMFEALPRPGPYVFGGAQPYSAIKTAWLGACKRAGLEGLRFHDLRHTWASYLVESGVDLRTVQELGGWSSLELVERYSHPTPDIKRRAIRVLEGLFTAESGHQVDTKTRVQGRDHALTMLS